MTVDDIGKLTLPQLEELFDGFEKANKDSKESSSKTLKGDDAIKYLMAQK